MSQEPFKVIEMLEDHTVIRFARFCSQRTTIEHEELFFQLLETTKHLVIDLKQTVVLSLSWWRFFGVLGVAAQRKGLKITIANANDVQKSNSDALGITPHLEFVNNY